MYTSASTALAFKIFLGVAISSIRKICPSWPIIRGSMTIVNRKKNNAIYIANFCALDLTDSLTVERGRRAYSAFVQKTIQCVKLDL